MSAITHRHGALQSFGYLAVHPRVWDGHRGSTSSDAVRTSLGANAARYATARADAHAQRTIGSAQPLIELDWWTSWRRDAAGGLRTLRSSR